MGNRASRGRVDRSFLGEIPRQLVSVALNETGGNFQSRWHFGGGPGPAEEWEIFCFWSGVGNVFLRARTKHPQVGLVSQSHAIND